MLAFHGTSGNRAFVDKLCEEGLRPRDHVWAHETTGIASHVFVCTSPIGTRGGDPIAFAQRFATDDRRAWLFVVDIDRALVRGAVPNGELEQYWCSRSFGALAFDNGAVHATRKLIEKKRAARCATRDLLAYHVRSVAEDLCDGPPDPHTLVQFERAYMRAGTRAAKGRVAASYRLRIPTWFAEDSHYPWCLGCMHNLFDIEVTAGDDIRLHRGAFDKLDLIELGMHFDALDRWLAAHGDPDVGSFAELQRRYPPPRDAVPRSMWPDFVTHDLDARWRELDTQLLVDHIPPARVVGVIDLGTRTRLGNRVRPRHGEVLIDKLNYLARELVAERGDRPLVVAD